VELEMGKPDKKLKKMKGIVDKDTLKWSGNRMKYQG
jgi:hypothetical protein